MSKIFWERRALTLATQTYLESAGWNNLEYKEGWGDPAKVDVISPPQISIDVQTTTPIELELGRTSGDRVYIRSVQFDVFAESEERVATLIEDLGEFIDQVVINIKDINDNTIGTMICYSSEDISLATFAPIITPELMRWRGAASAIYVAHYPNG